MKFRKLSKHMKEDEARLRENRQKLFELENEFGRKDEVRLLQQLQAIQNETKQFAKSIDYEIQNGQRMKGSIEQLSQQMGEGKVTENNNQESQLLKKTAHRMEQDLDQLTIKVNESLAYIRQLHEQVTSSRSERVIYSVIFKNLEKELMSKRAELKQLIRTKRRLESTLLWEAILETIPPDSPKDQDFPETQFEIHSPPNNQPSRQQTRHVNIKKAQELPLLPQQSSKEIGVNQETQGQYLNILRRELGMGDVSVKRIVELKGEVGVENERLCAEITRLQEEKAKLQHKIQQDQKAIQDIKSNYQVRIANDLSHHEPQTVITSFHHAIQAQQRNRSAMTQALLPLAAFLSIPTSLDLNETMSRIEMTLSEPRQFVGVQREEEKEVQDELGGVLMRVEQEKECYKLLTGQEMKERGRAEIKKLMKRKKTQK